MSVEAVCGCHGPRTCSVACHISCSTLEASSCRGGACARSESTCSRIAWSVSSCTIPNMLRRTPTVPHTDAHGAVLQLLLRMPVMPATRLFNTLDRHRGRRNYQQ